MKPHKYWNNFPQVSLQGDIILRPLRSSRAECAGRPARTLSSPWASDCTDIRVDSFKNTSDCRPTDDPENPVFEMDPVLCGRQRVRVPRGLEWIPRESF